MLKRRKTLWTVVGALVTGLLVCVEFISKFLGIADYVVDYVGDLIPIITTVIFVLAVIGVFCFGGALVGMIGWTASERAIWRYARIQDLRNDGPARRQFQACLPDIRECSQAIRDAEFPRNFFIYPDLRAKLLILSQNLTDLGIEAPPVDNGNPALVSWHLRLKELAVYAERGDIKNARR